MVEYAVISSLVAALNQLCRQFILQQHPMWTKNSRINSNSSGVHRGTQLLKPKHKSGWKKNVVCALFIFSDRLLSLGHLLLLRVLFLCRWSFSPLATVSRPQPQDTPSYCYSKTALPTTVSPTQIATTLDTAAIPQLRCLRARQKRKNSTMQL